MRLFTLCAVALLLAGCAESNVSRSSDVFGTAASSPRPKAIVVSDFAVSPDVLVLDRGFTSRLERKIGAFPTHERKQRTLERVNDEIVATVVATLREAGLDAQPGSEEGLTLSESAMVVNGRLRPSKEDAKKFEAGIGGGHGGVVADITLSSFSGFGKKQLLAFVAEPAGGRAPAGNAKATAAYNAAIAASLAAAKAAPEKLSPDVEAAARKIGRAAGDKIVGFAKAQGWLETPAGGKSEPATSEAPKPAGDADTQMVKLPASKPAKKPAA